MLLNILMMALLLIPVQEGQQWTQHKKITRVVTVAAVNVGCFLYMCQDMSEVFTCFPLFLKELRDKYNASPLVVGCILVTYSKLKTA